jgi:hypothetical protein
LAEVAIKPLISLAASAERCRRFDAGVQRKEVRLEGDLVDDADDLADLGRGGLDLRHGGDSPTHDVAALFGFPLSHEGSRSRLIGSLGGLVDAAGDVGQGRDRFLQARRLLFGALREVGRSDGDFGKTRLHRSDS